MRPAENYALSTLRDPSFWNAVASGRKCRDLAILSTLFLAIGPAWAPVGCRVTNRAAVRGRIGPLNARRHHCGKRERGRPGFAKHDPASLARHLERFSVSVGSRTTTSRDIIFTLRASIQGLKTALLELLNILLVDRCPQSAHRVYTFSA